MSQKRIIFFIAIFLVFLILIPLFISKFSKALPDNPVPTPSITLPAQVISSPTPISSFPKAGLEMVILKNQEASVPYTDLTIKLTDIFVPKKGCFDCITSARVEVKSSQDLKILEYGSGGFVGTVVDKLDAFGYTFTVLEYKEESTKIKVTENE